MRTPEHVLNFSRNIKNTFVFCKHIDSYKNSFNRSNIVDKFLLPILVVNKKNKKWLNLYIYCLKLLIFEQIVCLLSRRLVPVLSISYRLRLRE